MTPNRAALLAEADSLIHKNTFTKEDSARVEQLLALADACTDRHEIHNALLASRAIELGRKPAIPVPVEPEFMAFLRGGLDALPAEKARSIRAAGEAVGTGSAGGYLVPQSFADRFESILQLYDKLFSVAMIFETATGSATGYPILDDVANAAAIVAESSASTAGPDFVFAALAFAKCPTWRSGMIRASVELTIDTAFDFQSLLAGAGAVRIARGVGAAFVATLLNSSVLGKTCAATGAIASDELFDLVDSVDPEYQANGSFLMARPTLTAILKLKGTGSGDYLFESALDSAGRPQLLGFPVHLCPSMPAIAAGAKAVSFGDHSKFVRRQVKNSLAVKTYVERYAEFSQVGYEVFLRVDGDLLKSGNNVPVRYMALHA